MITVRFMAPPSHDPHDWLNRIMSDCTMPWLEYLMNNCERYTVKQYYYAPAHQDEISYIFHLPPAKQTYYMLKYNS